MLTFINGPATINLFYSNKMRAHAYIRFMVHVFEYFPVFNFCVGYGLIAMHAADSFDARSMNWVDGEYFGDEMFAKSTERISM